MSETLFVVHTMGKVGSRSVVHVLQKAGLRTVHAHYLIFPSRPEDGAARTEVLGWKGPICLITIAREPIARNLSAYYQNYVKDEPASVIDFMMRYPQRVPLDWFWGEFHDFWGQGASEFMPHLRNIFVKTNCHWPRGKNILNMIMARDDSLKHLPQALESIGFMGIDVPPMITVNKNEDYLELVKNAKFPREYIREMYWALYSRAFWNQAELEELMEKWVDEKTSS